MVVKQHKYSRLVITWLQPWFKSGNIEYLLPSIDVPILAIKDKSDQYASIAQMHSIQNLYGGKVYSHILEHCENSLHLDVTDEVLLLMTIFIGNLPSKTAE